MIRFCTVKRYAELSGYTERAIESKISRGDWTYGRQYVRAPDGRIFVSIEGVEKWLQSIAASTSRMGSAGSRTTHRTVASGSRPGYRIPPKTARQQRTS